MSFDITPLFTIEFARRVIFSIVGVLLFATPEILTATTGAILPLWKESIIGGVGCLLLGAVFGETIMPLVKIIMSKKGDSKHT